MQPKSGLVLRAERLFRTDIRYLLSGGFWLTLGQIVASLSSLVLAILFANLIPKETYGTYKYVLSVVSILSIFNLAGVSTTVAQSIAQGREGTFLTALRLRIRWGLLGLLASFGLSFYYYLQGNHPLAVCFFIAGMFVPVMDPISLYNLYLTSKKLFKESIILYFLSQIAASGIMALVLIFSGNLYLILFAYFGSWTGARYVSHRITLKKFPPNSHEDAEAIYKGIHLSFIGVLTAVVSNIDTFFIFHFLGAAPTALYTIATAPIDQLRGWFKTLGALALPKLANRPVREINVLVTKRMLGLSLFGLCGALIYASAASFLFHLVFPKYVEGISVSIVFAFTLVLQLPILFLGTVINSKIDLIPKRWLYWSSLPQSVLILATLVLIPLFGLWGMVAGVFIQLMVSLTVLSVQWRMLLRYARD